MEKKFQMLNTGGPEVKAFFKELPKTQDLTTNADNLVDHLLGIGKVASYYNSHAAWVMFKNCLIPVLECEEHQLMLYDVLLNTSIYVDGFREFLQAKTFDLDFMYALADEYVQLDDDTKHSVCRMTECLLGHLQKWSSGVASPFVVLNLN